MLNRRIEYVFGPPRPSTGHSLGVSALAISNEMLLTTNSYGTLVSGGRDGRLNAWVLTPDQTHAGRVNDIHTNWVCDIVIHNAETVVSCSADTTVKTWNLRTNAVTTIGHHTDYAQCLARLSDDCVVSGGLDGSIIGWNVHIGKKVFEIKTNRSIYSLAAVPDPTGNSHIVVSGTHDGTVSVWDTRQPEYADSNFKNSADSTLSAADHSPTAIAVFKGHTDNVRCLCAPNSDTIISGSSDATVKVWSLSTGRVQSTFQNFHSSVWSLKPTKDGMGFWAGDRDGNIYHSPNLETEPQVVVEHACKEGGLHGLCPNYVSNNIWLSTPFSPDLRCIDPYNGGSRIARLKGHSGLRKHRLLNDKRHVLVADTSGKIGMVDLVSAKSTNFERHIDLANTDVDAELNNILNEVNTMDVLDNWCLVQIKTGKICVTLDHRSINNTEVYLDDLQNHVTQIHKTPVPTPQPSPQGTPAASPMVTPQNSGFFNQSNSGFFRQGRSPFVSPAVSRVTSTQSVVDLNRQGTPASGNSAARQRKLGTGKGHAMFYDPDEEDNENEQERSQSSRDFQDARQTPPVPPSSGFPKLKVTEEETEEPADSETADDEIRINLGNFVLENLFRGVTDRLKKEYDELPAPPAVENGHEAGNSRASTVSPSPSHAASHHEHSDGASAHNRPERRRTRFFNKLFGRKRDDDGDSSTSASFSHNLPSFPGHSHSSGAATAQQDDNGGENSASAAGDDSTPTNPQLIKQKHQQQQQNMPDSSSFLEAWSRAVAHHCLESADPESPKPDVLSRKARLIVTEIASDAGAPTEIYSTTVGHLINNKSDVDNIERLLPGWVGDALLLGKLNLKPPSKIGFAVLPGQSGLPDLTSESTRLMAISMLRIRKIMAYTVGQLQQQGTLSSRASEYPPEDIIRLTCHGTEISALTTLATVRTRIWRKGGDVGMEYSLKKEI